MAFTRKHARNSRHRRRSSGLNGGTTPPTPLPAPAFSLPASIQHDGSPATGEQLLGVDGVANYPIVSRRWLLGSTVLATTNAVAAQLGTLVFESLTRSPDGREAVSRAEIMVGDGSAATITSAANSQSFARSTRYHRATADRAGTWDIAPGSDGARYEVTDAARGIYARTTAAVAADAGISGDRVDTYTRRFTPADGSAAVVQVFTNTIRPIGTATAVSENYTAPLAGATGTRLDALPGWMVVNKAGTSGTRMVPVLTGDGRLRGGSAAADRAEWGVIRYPMNSPVGSTLEFEVGAPLADYSTVAFTLAADGYDNRLLVSYIFRTGRNTGLFANHRARQSGVEGDITPVAQVNAAVYPRSDGSTLIRITRTSTRLRFTIIGSTVDGSASVSAYAEYDLAAGTYGAGYGFGGTEGQFGASAMSENIRVTSITYVKSGSTLSVPEYPVAVAGNVVRFPVLWTGTKPTGGYEHRFRIGSGAWSAWLIGESVIADDGTSTYDASYPTIGDYETQIRMRDDTPTVTTAPSVLVGYAPAPFELGTNQGAGASYGHHSPHDDFGKTVDPLNETGASYKFANQGIVGVYDLDLPPGYSLTGVWDNGVGSCQVTGPTALTVTADLDYPGIRYMTFSPGLPEYVNARRRGGGAKISQAWIDDWGGWTTWRTLDCTFTNATPVTGTIPKNKASDRRYAHSVTTGIPLPFEDILDGAAALATRYPQFQRVWHTLERDLSDAEIADIFTKFRDHPTLDKRVKLAFEDGNEDWNFAMFVASRRRYLEGVQRGYGAVGATAAAPGAPEIVTYNPVYKGATPSLVASGTLLMSHEDHFSEIGCFRAKKDVPAGSPLPVFPATENEWYRYATEINPQRAGKLWRAIRLKQIIEIGKSVMGEAAYYARCEPMLMGFGAAGNITHMNDELSVPGLEAELQKNGGIGAACYFYADGFTAFNADGSSKAVSGADVIAALDASYPAYIAMIANVAREALLRGIRPAFYEGISSHPTPEYQKGSRYQVAWDNAHVTDALRLRYARRVSYVRRNVPGLFCLFATGFGLPYNIRNSYTDVDNPLWRGVREGLAA